MTHQQLVKEWKEKFEKMFFVHLPYKGKNGLVFDCSCHDPEHKWVISPDARPKEVMAFLEEMTLAAAKGAAEAGKLGKYQFKLEDYVPLVEKWKGKNFDVPFDHGFDAAISQSERQLEDYFKEV